MDLLWALLGLGAVVFLYVVVMAESGKVDALEHGYGPRPRWTPNSTRMLLGLVVVLGGLVGVTYAFGVGWAYVYMLAVAVVVLAAPALRRAGGGTRAG